MTTEAKVERLLRSLADSKRVMAKHFHADSTITKAQYEILWQIKGGTHRVVDMANNLQISTSATTQLVQQLVESGYIERQASATDRREVVLSLTKSGQQVMEKFHANLKRWAEGIVSALSDDEVDLFIAINQKIADYLKTKEE